MILLLFLFNIVFIYFFYQIGLRYLSFIPVFFLLFLIYISSDTNNDNGGGIDFNTIKSFIINNLFLLSWLLINIGIGGILFNLKEFGIEINYLNQNTTFLFLGLFNFGLLCISYLFSYKDGIKTFHIGYYFNLLIFFYYIFSRIPLNDFIEIIISFIALTFALYSFLTFVIGALTKNEQENLKYENFLFFILTIFISIYLYFKPNLYITISVTQIALMLIFLYIFLISVISKKIIKEEKNTQDKIEPEYSELRKILNGETNKEKKIQINKFIKWTVIDIDIFFKNFKPTTKFILSSLNVIFIFFQIYLLFTSFQSGKGDITNEIFYWSSVIIFFINFLLLKYINFYSFIQRIFVFFIINFGIYVSILDFFGQNNLLYIVIVGIIWNLLNNIIIFFSKQMKFTKILLSEDYYRWILANSCATLTNLYFLLKLEINSALKVSIIILYVGIQLALLFYNLKYIEKITLKK